MFKQRRLFLAAAFVGGGLFGVPLLIIVLVPVLMLIGGLAFHQASDPPPFPQSPAFSDQWINLSYHVTAANHVYAAIPNSVWIAVIQNLSNGAVLSDQTHGHGLFASPNPHLTGHPLKDFNAAVPVLKADWDAHHYKSNSLAEFMSATQNPPGDFVHATKQDIVALSTSPMIAAWPATGWKNGQWQYPSGSTAKTWVLVAGSAPVGLPTEVPWKPPTCAWIHGKDVCVPNNIAVSMVEPPTSVTIKSDGYNGPMLSSLLIPAGQKVPAWPHAAVWGADVIVNQQHPVTITAHWPTFSLSVTLPSATGFSVGGGGGNGNTPGYNPTSIKAAIQHWWQDILVASQRTGVPAAWIAGEMILESGGRPDAGSPGGAFGLMQLEPQTAASLPGYYPGARHNPQENLILGAELLAENYQQFQSWYLASSAYYGGAGAVEDAGVTPSMSWTQAESLLANVVPDPQAGNTLSLAQYALDVAAYAQMAASDENLPGPFSS
ncbi:lytic transglycosylase domain-containing protein [Sulfobacillus thermosulfidooxidans]|uniref:lytic transglycosylase domain-containing protein n=1 Tax=Sulfobacillus thermosulfidooxidans TaxID=28034 RepID=UPI0006B46D3B|nr:lytic transglycosylase domain-containing protein [Sulfobacillus thermosulfidooxidans]